MSDPLEEVLGWVSSHPGSGLGPIDVPGATPDELAGLAALGRICGELLSNVCADQGSNPPEVSTDPRVNDWFAGRTCPKPPVAIVEALAELLDTDGEDGLASLYARLVAPARRRTLGTFFTRALEVDRMIGSWAENAPPPSTVIDVGAGVGIYTTSAAAAWPEATVHALDVNPVTLGLLALRLAHRSATAPASRAPVRASQQVPTSASGEPSAGLEAADIHLVLDDYVAWAADNWASLPAPRLVLGNPPYTRMQLLPPEVRADLFDRADGLVGRRASLAVLMTAITVTLLEASDGLCLLLPAQWLESDYAEGLRTWLWGATTRRVELRLFSSSLFDDAQVDAVSLMVGPECSTVQPFRVGTENGLVDRERSGVSPAQWRSLFEEPGPDSRNLASGACVERSHVFTFSEGTDTLFSAAPNRSPALSDLAVIRRGVATGANWFFVLTQAEREQWGIPDQFLRPLMRRLRDPRSKTLEKRPWLYSPEDERPFRADMDSRTVAEMAWLLVTGRGPRCEAVEAYIASGERRGAGEALLCGQRSPWHDLTSQLHDVDVAISPMSKGTFRILEAPERAVVLNNLYGLTWKPDISGADRASALAFLRSAPGQESIQRAARSQANNLLKIEPRALGAVIVG